MERRRAHRGVREDERERQDAPGVAACDFADLIRDDRDDIFRRHLAEPLDDFPHHVLDGEERCDRDEREERGEEREEEVIGLLGGQVEGHSRVLTLLNGDVAVKPATLMVSKVTVKKSRYTNILMGTVQAAIANWDGCFAATNNYEIYRDPSRARFVMLPWGEDQTFGKRDQEVIGPDYAIDHARLTIVCADPRILQLFSVCRLEEALHVDSRYGRAQLNCDEGNHASAGGGRGLRRRTGAGGEWPSRRSKGRGGPDATGISS